LGYGQRVRTASVLGIATELLAFDQFGQRIFPVPGALAAQSAQDKCRDMQSAGAIAEKPRAFQENRE
jgi:hypothetical protein